MKQKWFKTDGEHIKFIGTCAQMDVPQSYFDMKIAAEYGGECFEVLAVCNIRFFSDVEATKPIGGLETVNIPTPIKLYPSGVEAKTMKLLPNMEEEEEEAYRVLTFYKDDVFTDKFIIQSSSNAEKFLKVLENAKLPRTIQYSSIYDIWTRNMVMNNVTMPDIPASNREMIVAEIYRYKKVPQDRFSLHIGKDPKMSQYEYIPANSRTLTKYNSTFAGITFEDMDTMITNGLNISKNKKKQTISPIEEIIKY